MHQDDSPPSRWTLQVSWTATACVLAFLLGSSASLAATPVGSTAKLEDTTMRWALGQPYTDPKAPEVHDPATPPELMIRYLQSHWTDQDHEVLRANGPLGWRTLQEGKPFCYGMMQQSAANKSQLLFSPTALALPLRLIVAKSRVPELPRNAVGEVDLAQMLRQGRWHGALSHRRGYGPEIDALLPSRRAQSKRSNLSYFSPIGYGARVLTMLQHGRADYTVGPEWILLSTAPGDRSADGLVALPIEGANKLIPMGIGCPRSAWGRAAIARINRILSTPEGADMLKQSYQVWYSPERQRQYARQLDQFYRQRARAASLP